MTDRSDTLSANAATILAGMLIAKQADTHQASAPAFVQDAVAAAFKLEADVMAHLRKDQVVTFHPTVSDRRRPYFGEKQDRRRGEQDRRRVNGGWDTPEQQDADDAHRRVERRRSNLPPPPPAFLTQPAIYLGPDRRGSGLGHGEAPTLREKRTGAFLRGWLGGERRKTARQGPSDPERRGVLDPRD
jgi:hypothetical protein